MKKEDLKNWTREQMKSEISRLHRKLELFGIKFEENPNNFSFFHNGNRYYAGKLVNDYAALKEENTELKERVKEQREKIDSLLKELEEEKGKTITISDGAITMRADMWEALNENKALKDENTALKQHIKDMEDVCDGSCFSDYEDLPFEDDEHEWEKLINELQDQHQQDCIKINQLHVTIDTLVDKYSRLRKSVGMD